MYINFLLDDAVYRKDWESVESILAKDRLEDYLLAFDTLEKYEYVEVSFTHRLVELTINFILRNPEHSALDLWDTLVHSMVVDTETKRFVVSLHPYEKRLAEIRKMEKTNLRRYEALLLAVTTEYTVWFQTRRKALYIIIFP